jgi:hypothetical protein
MSRNAMQPNPGFNFFAPLTFQVHEFGHLFFSFGGVFLTILGGSLMQVLVPLGAVALMGRQRDFFGMAFFATWLASSLVDLSAYIGDAQALELDLVSLGVDGGDTGDDSNGTGHDWQWLLMQMKLLPYDRRIAAVVRGTGELILWSSAAFGAWVCWLMWRAGASDAPPPSAPRPGDADSPRSSGATDDRPRYRLR